MQVMPVTPDCTLPLTILVNPEGSSELSSEEQYHLVISHSPNNWEHIGLNPFEGNNYLDIPNYDTQFESI